MGKPLPLSLKAYDTSKPALRWQNSSLLPAVGKVCRNVITNTGIGLGSLLEAPGTVQGVAHTWEVLVCPPA